MKYAVLTVVFIIQALSGIQAHAGGLSHWQGDFISRKTLLHHPEMQALYAETAREAGRIGKSYTPEGVRQFFAQLFHTDFYRISIQGDAITFFSDVPGRPDRLTLTFSPEGLKQDRYGDMTFSWHAFRADTTAEDRDAPYTHLLLMDISRRNGGEPHFHIRYAGDGYGGLTGPAAENWWPTMLTGNFDMARFKAAYSPEEMATLLP